MCNQKTVIPDTSLQTQAAQSTERHELNSKQRWRPSSRLGDSQGSPAWTIELVFQFVNMI